MPLSSQGILMGAHKAWCHIAGWQVKLGTQITSGNSLAGQQSRSRGQVCAYPSGQKTRAASGKGHRAHEEPHNHSSGRCGPGGTPMGTRLDSYAQGLS